MAFGYEDELRAEISRLRNAVRSLLDDVNARHPEKPPRDWSCPYMAELDRLVPPTNDAIGSESRDMEDLADGEDPFIAYPRAVHLCSFHTCSGTVKVKGKEWSFDFSERFGPLWIRKDGESRANQNPPPAVWRAFDRWNRRRCATAGREGRNG